MINTGKVSSATTNIVVIKLNNGEILPGTMSIARVSSEMIKTANVKVNNAKTNTGRDSNVRISKEIPPELISTGRDNIQRANQAVNSTVRISKNRLSPSKTKLTFANAIKQKAI